MDGGTTVINKSQVISHFWPEPIEHFFIFSYNKYGFLTFNEIIYYETDE